MAPLPPSRHPLHCGLRIPDLRARDDSPLRGSCHHALPAICLTRRLPAQRIRRCGLNATFRTRLQQCDGDWSPLSPRCYRVAHAARLGTDTEICDTVRLGTGTKKQQISVMPMPWAISVHFSKADGADHKALRLQESGMSKQLSTAESPCTISAPCLRMVAGHRRT